MSLVLDTAFFTRSSWFADDLQAFGNLCRASVGRIRKIRNIPSYRVVAGVSVRSRCLTKIEKHDNVPRTLIDPRVVASKFAQC